MPFKAEWETKPCPLNHEQLQACIVSVFGHPYPYQLLSGGQANINLTVSLPATKQILKLYLREPQAAYKEQRLLDWVAKALPVPKILSVGTWQQWTYGVMTFENGLALRDRLTSSDPSWPSCVQEAGRLLGQMQRFTFEQPGSLDAKLQSVPMGMEILPFVKSCLEHPNVQSSCSKALLFRLRYCFDKFGSLLLDPQEVTLVHGDYDPANILVHSEDGQLRVSAILDWEFAFAGSFLWDVANMLRYAHHMDEAYERAFVQGLEESGVVLPSDWRQTVAMMNLGAIIDLITRTDLKAQRRIKDLVGLLEHHSSAMIQGYTLKPIEILPYQPEWPERFLQISNEMREVLKEHVEAIHHIGSTAVPGLSAKEDIDVLCVVKDLAAAHALQDIGYVYKGEFNIPLRCFFSKNSSDMKVNAHVVPVDHPLIEQQLVFRDFLRNHPDDLEHYQQLKLNLLNDPSSFEKHPGQFSQYTLSKNTWIKNTLRQAGFKGFSFNFCLHEQEWEAFEALVGSRQLAEDQTPWVMYEGTEIIAAALVGESVTLYIKQGHEQKRQPFEHFIQRWLRCHK